jgi:hypothetical protein
MTGLTLDRRSPSLGRVVADAAEHARLAGAPKFRIVAQLRPVLP